MIRSITGTLEIGCTVETTDEVNVSTLLKGFLSFTEFHIQPLQGGDQIITWSNGVPVTKECIDLYFQYNIVKDGV
jgi:hypothetical protein